MVIVLTGKNTFALLSEMKKIVAEFIKTSGDSVERFDGIEMTDANGLLNAVRSISFLEPRKLVIVRDFSQNSAVMASIEEIVEQTADSTDLLLVDQKLDKRTSGYKYLKKNVDMHDHKELQEYELASWLQKQSKEINAGFGASLGAVEAKLLVSMVGADQQRLYGELEKLSLSGELITKNKILELVERSPQSKVFDMLDALFNKNLEKAWDLYIDQRAQGEDPHKILAMITWQLTQLTLAVYAPVKSKDALMSAGMSPFGADKALSMSKNLRPNTLKRYITELADLDAEIKTSADVESALEFYFAMICSDQEKVAVIL